MKSKPYLIQNSSEFEGKVVQLRGWVYQKRSSGKIKFLILRDGTGLIQGVLFKGECEDASFEAFDQLTQESSVQVTGLVKKEPRSSSGYEMAVQSIEVLQIADPYPISPKEHGVEFLMQNRHLWMRSSRQWAALRIRSEIIRSIHEFFEKISLFILMLRFSLPVLAKELLLFFLRLILMRKLTSHNRVSSTLKQVRWRLEKPTFLDLHFELRNQRRANI